MLLYIKKCTILDLLLCCVVFWCLLAKHFLWWGNKDVTWPDLIWPDLTWSTWRNETQQTRCRIQFSMPTRFFGGPGILSRTSLASLDFFMITSFSRSAVCMRLTSVWFLTKETLKSCWVSFTCRNSSSAHLIYFFLLQSFTTYRFSHSLQQRVSRKIMIIMIMWKTSRTCAYIWSCIC